MRTQARRHDASRIGTPADRARDQALLREQEKEREQERERKQERQEQDLKRQQQRVSGKTPVPCTAVVRLVPMDDRPGSLPGAGAGKEKATGTGTALCAALDRELGSVGPARARGAGPASASTPQARNPTAATTTGEIYGVLVGRDTNQRVLTGLEESKGVGQDAVDAAVATVVVPELKEIESQLENKASEGPLPMVGTQVGPAKRTVLRRVLTYFSENTVTMVEQNNPGDKDGDQATDPFMGSGKWVGVARVYMTPLTVGSGTMYELASDTGDGAQFPADVPYVVRVLSCTFGVSSVTLATGSMPQGVKYLGPVRTTMQGVPCTVAYVSPDKIRDDEQVQDAGDSYVVQRREKVKGENGYWVETFFCGTGVTTRTRTGYEANENRPLYDAGMQKATETHAAETGVSVAAPTATHKLVLEKTSRDGEKAAENTYRVEEMTEDDKTGRRWTAADVSAFQTAQMDAKKTAKRVDVEVPLWGAVQVEVPLSAIRGYVVSSVVAAGGSVTAIESAVVNTNLVLSVEVAVDKAGDAQTP